MNILVLGGTRFFGVPMVEELIDGGHNVTVATRGNTKGFFGERVSYTVIDRNNPDSLKRALSDSYFDVVYDKIAYCSNDIKYLLDCLNCGKYIYMSTSAVYKNRHFDIKEYEFNPVEGDYKWCNRPDYPYNVVKAYAERAIFQEYPDVNSVAVRYPVVLGSDDYTERLKFYVEHTLNEKPMYVDNPDEKLCFIRSDEAGKFLAYLSDKYFIGTVNGCSHGTVSISEIISYVEQKTGKRAKITEDGDSAPYNGERSYSLNTDKAEGIGFDFLDVKEWVFELVDYYINSICF